MICKGVQLKSDMSYLGKPEKEFDEVVRGTEKAAAMEGYGLTV